MNEKREYEEVKRFLENLSCIRRRPQMYFGQNYGYKQLAPFLFGYMLGSNSTGQNHESLTCRIHNNVNYKVLMAYAQAEKEESEGRNAFEDYFKFLKEEIETNFPELNDLV